jgi:hypothetical protein
VTRTRLVKVSCARARARARVASRTRHQLHLCAPTLCREGKGHASRKCRVDRVLSACYPPSAPAPTPWALLSPPSCFYDQRDHDGAASSPVRPTGRPSASLSVANGLWEPRCCHIGSQRQSGSMCAQLSPCICTRRLKERACSFTSSSCPSPPAACPSCRRGWSPCQA